MRIVILGCLLVVVAGCSVQAPPLPPAPGPLPPPSRYDDQLPSLEDRTDLLKELLERRHSAANTAVRVGSISVRPHLIRRVNPVYPEAAIDERVQGVVVLEVFIGVDGQVADARVLRSVPLLDKAAVDAVLQWEYAPTQLFGTTTPVIMTVAVTFSLAR